MDESERNPWDAPEDDPTPADESAPSPPKDEAPADPAPVPAPAAARAAVPAAEAAGPSVRVETPAAAAAPPASQEAEIDPNRNRVVLIALAAFVVIAVVGFILAQGGDDKPPGTDDAGTATTVVTGVGSTVPAQALVIKGTEEPFSRADDATSLGSVPNGSKWTAQKGSTWGISGGQAYVAKPDSNDLHRNIAFIGSGFANGQVEVTVAKMATTAGIVFRYTSECSYWALESAPTYATWNVTKVDKCNATTLGNTGYTALDDGVKVGVVLTDSTVTVVINDKVVKVIQDASLSDNPGGVGMTVSGPDSATARFDDFIAGGPEGQGILTASTGDKNTPTTKPK